MGKKDLYTIRQNKPDDVTYECVKVDPDSTSVQVYHISDLPGGAMICTCPAGGRPTCRHRQMLRLFQAEERINSGWMYQFDSKKWFEPQTDDQNGE